MSALDDKIAQAKSAGYSDQEIQQYISQKTQAAKTAGYSDSEIQQYLGNQSKPTTPNGTDKLASQIQSLKAQGVDPSVTNVQEQKLKMLQQGQQLPPSLGPTSEFFNKTGQNVAEGLAQNGVNPYVSAAAGTATQMVPHLAAAGESLLNPETAISPVAKGVENVGGAVGKAADVITAPLKSTSENAINIAEKGAGVMLRAPVTKEIATDLELPKGSQTFSHVTNTITDKLTAGENIPLQTAKDFLVKGSTEIKDMGKEEAAPLAKAMALVRSYVNKQIPDRAGPAADLANAYLRSKVLKYGLPAGGAAGGAMAYALNKLGLLGK